MVVFGIEFLWARWLPLVAPTFLAALLVLFFKTILKLKLFSLLTNPFTVQNVFSSFSKNKIIFSSFLLGLVCFLLTLIFLRISWGEKTTVIPQMGRNVLVGLDISRSMLAQDISPSRLDFAKIKIKDLLNKLGPERVGLQVFASDSVLQCPFTHDFSAFNMFLGQLDSMSVSSGKTMISKAIDKSLEIFERNEIFGSKILILVTDGEDFSPSLERSMQKAKESGISVVVLGIGTKDGAPVPVLDNLGNPVGHEKNSSGEIILTKLELEKISNVVKNYGGITLSAVYSSDDVDYVAKHVDSFEKSEFSDNDFTSKEERYPIFAAIAGLVLTFEWIL